MGLTSVSLPRVPPPCPSPVHATEQHARATACRWQGRAGASRANQKVAIELPSSNSVPKVSRSKDSCHVSQALRVTPGGTVAPLLTPGLLQALLQLIW